MRNLRRPDRAARQTTLLDGAATQCQQTVARRRIHTFRQPKYAELLGAPHYRGRVANFQDEGEMPSTAVHRGLQTD